MSRQLSTLESVLLSDDRAEDIRQSILNSYQEKLHGGERKSKAYSRALLGRRKLSRSLAPVDLLAPRRPLKRRCTLVCLDRSLTLSKRAGSGSFVIIYAFLLVCTRPDSMPPSPSGWEHYS